MTINARALVLLVLSLAPQALGQPRPAPPLGGPWSHRVLSATSVDGLAWTRDPGVRMEHASVPYAVVAGERIFLYFVDADRGPGEPESVACAVSADGLRFGKQPFAIEGMPAKKAIDPCVLRDRDGTFRLYSFASSAPGDPAAEQGEHEIHPALSDDGIRFRNVGPAFRYPRLVDPDVFPFKGTWFMYVFGGGETVISTSRDGRSFTYKQPLALPGWGTVKPVEIEDGRLRLYAFEQRRRAGNRVCSFLSTDGLEWTEEAGDRLVAAHQHFPEEDEAGFDKVAVRFSSDEGRTWSEPQVIRLTGLPEGMRFPFDPTLVPLPDGRIRLYFTSLRGRLFEEDVPAIHSAVSTNGLDYQFEPRIRFGIEGRPVVDCAVVLHQGVFHLYAPDNGPQRRPGARPGEGPSLPAPPPGVGYHATSSDGLLFTRAEDVRIDGRRRWLGNAQSDGKEITFFGTGDPSPAAGPGAERPRGGVWMAVSRDGQTWTLLEDRSFHGADPGAVRTTDGGWVVVSTGPPRPGTPSARRPPARP